MKRQLAILVLLLCAIAISPAPIMIRAQTPTPTQRTDYDQQVEQLLASLTPEERVGQLMLLTFEGTNLRPETAISQLITDFNIGGVVLQAKNDNINGQINAPRLVQALTTDLQQLAHDTASATAGQRAVPRPFVPLFIATNHAGGGIPYTQIEQGTTPIPNLMALGATWNPGYARQVGEITGFELTAMGVNMLLGPALDVAQQPHSERALDLGVNVFGGNPYWVGKLGAAYVDGVHTGGQGRIAVVAQHFPGLGLADTDPDQEIPVVPRSINELRLADLVPFATVTDPGASANARIDGLQCTNIRYQGDSIRATTNPLCTDSTALDNLLNLDEFQAWRTNGIVVSAPLGTPAIRRYYTTFNPRQVAREAFWAGNDLLYIADFGPNPGEDQLANVVNVIRFFAARHRSDPVFRNRIDQSVRRILRLKLALYNGDISLDNVLQPVNPINSVGTFTAEIYEIAQDSVTVLAPRRESLPRPPGLDENIVIFTDVRLVQQCSYCATYPQVTVNALEKAIEETYGPFGGAQISPDQVVSFSFSQLQTYLSDDPTETGDQSSQFKTNQRIGEALRDMDWLVFLMLDLRSGEAASQVMRAMLASESSILTRAQVIVITLGPPIDLSSTEISKFAAYYALYGYTTPYIDTAVRTLFQETVFPGASPVSVPAVGYNLDEVTAPDPAQTIRLDIESINQHPLAATLNVTDPIPMRVGQRLALHTSPVLDRNGNPVPDNTPVEFTLTFLTDSLQNRQVSTTHDGVASTTFTPTRVGRVQITATSGNARRSTTMQIIVTEESMPSAATASAGSDGTPASTNGISGTPVGANPDTGLTPPADTSPFGTDRTMTTIIRAEYGSSHRLEVMDFVLSLFGLALLGAWGFFAGRTITLTMDGGIRLVLSCVVAGLIGYIYYGVGGPGAQSMHQQFSNLASPVITLGTGLVGLLVAWWALRNTQV